MRPESAPDDHGLVVVHSAFVVTQEASVAQQPAEAGFDHPPAAACRRSRRSWSTPLDRPLLVIMVIAASAEVLDIAGSLSVTSL